MVLQGNQSIFVSSKRSADIKTSIANGEVIGTLPQTNLVLSQTIVDSLKLENLNAIRTLDVIEKSITDLETAGFLTADQSKIKKDYLYVSRDEEAGIDYVVLTAIPEGDIISVIIHTPEEDLQLDGTFNRAGNRLEFTNFISYNDVLNFRGNYATILYLTK